MSVAYECNSRTCTVVKRFVTETYEWWGDTTKRWYAEIHTTQPYELEYIRCGHKTFK